MARKLTLFTISLTILSAVFGGCADHEVEIRNNCCQQIWVGILGNYGKPHLEEGNLVNLFYFYLFIFFYFFFIFDLYLL